MADKQTDHPIVSDWRQSTPAIPISHMYAAAKPHWASDTFTPSTKHSAGADLRRAYVRPMYLPGRADPLMPKLGSPMAY